MRRVTESYNTLSLSCSERVPANAAADSLGGLTANRLRLVEDGVFRLRKSSNLPMCV